MQKMSGAVKLSGMSGSVQMLFGGSVHVRLLALRDNAVCTRVPSSCCALVRI